MFISDFAIKRPIVTVVTMVALVIFGTYSLLRLQTDEFPDIANPIVSVSVPYPGASPAEVEREVIDRIEEAVNGISGVDRIQSSATDGFANIIITFVFEKEESQASQDVRDAISGIRSDLPTEMKEPVITKFDPNDLPILQLALSSTNLTSAELTRLADPPMTRRLRGINGVATVDVVGKVERQLVVQVRPSDLNAKGVSVAQVAQALQQQNLAAPVGRISAPLDERTIRLRGRLDRPEDFLNLVVAQRGGQLIRLGEVADVLDASDEPRSMALFNGREGIGLNIKKSKGISTTEVSDKIKAELPELQRMLPPGTKLDIVQDAGERVRRSVRNVEEALIEGALLTVLVVFLFLNSWRSTVITGLALPVSTLAAFIAVYAFGFTLNTMSLLGLSLAIGILIDDAIVVRENIVRHIEMGKDHVTASHEGTDEIGLAVTATTFSIVAVFVPVAFMYGVAGQWFKPFALTIACAVMVSLFVSFSLDPMLSAYWPDPQTEAHQRGNALARAIDRFNAWFDRQADRYKGAIAWALDHRAAMMAIAVGSFVAAIIIPAKGALAAIVVAAAVLAIVLVLGWKTSWIARAAAIVVIIFAMGAGVKRVPNWRQLGGQFVPESDRSEINIALETPPGSNLDYTRIKSEEIGRMLRAHREVSYTYTTIGSASAFGGGTVDQANIYVRMIPKKNRPGVKQEEFARTVRDEIAHIGGVTPYVFASGFGGNRKQMQIEIRGAEVARLNQLADTIVKLVRTIPGAVDIGLSTRGQRPELDVQLNRGLAGTLGLTVGTIAQSLRPAFAGLESGYWVDPSGETRKVVVRLAPEARTRPADLGQLPIVVAGTAPAGSPAAPPSTLPLGQVADIKNSLGPAQIDHLDRDKVIIVGANASGRSLGEVSADALKKLQTIPLPAGYRITQGGEVKDQGDVFTRIFAALGLAVLLMYLILVVQFGSFLDPVAIMFSLPLSLIGVVLALDITGGTLNIMSLIGVILLMGIVAKNAILLIDFAKWAREEQGMPLRDALVQAGRIRLRPIIMTTLALIAGMIPVAIGAGEGADFRAPLGRAIIGGVITSTFLTLLVIPTFYEVIDEFREWSMGLFGRKPAQHTATMPVPEHGD